MRPGWRRPGVRPHAVHRERHEWPCSAVRFGLTASNTAACTIAAFLDVTRFEVFVVRIMFDMI